MYEVIYYFTDLQDNGYPYNAGDMFPRDGLTVSKERLKELSSSNNKRHKPLIKIMEDKPLTFSDNEIELKEDSAKKKYTKSEIQRMTTAELHNLAAAEGIENAFETNGNELKKILTQHFGL